ncbi:MAG TPA: hypothetical protein VLH09_06950 [Bryobacteraceae bacterium]|nr:hypothetical protein [Bryobacteraceae bacterium]
MWRVLVALALAAAAWCQTGGEERSVGPLAFRDRSFQATVSAESIRITDAEGAVHFERKLPNGTTADVAPLAGKNGAGLLVTYETKAAVPPVRSWEVLGVLDGKLTSFGLPILPDGGLQPGAPGWDADLRVDVLNFRVSAGNFFVIVPVEVNWESGSVRLAYVLVKRCRMAVEVSRKPVEAAATVRLFPGTDEEAGKPASVQVRKDSVVELLGSEGRVMWEEFDDRIALSVAEDIWLRVRIDGKEGYLRSPEDFEAIGLPEAI